MEQATPEYDFFMINNPTMLDDYAEGMVPLIREYLDVTNAVEMDVFDVFNAVQTGTAYAFLYATKVPSPDVKLVLIVEIVQYPKTKVLNILVLSGEGLKDLADKHWDKFKGWAYMIGARAIEGIMREPVARLVRPLGFDQKAVFSRALL